MSPGMLSFMRGCMGVWVHGCMPLDLWAWVWVRRCVGVWVQGCMDAWVCAWVRECMGVWVGAWRMGAILRCVRTQLHGMVHGCADACVCAGTQSVWAHDSADACVGGWVGV